jgi:hypothetical protein
MLGLGDLQQAELGAQDLSAEVDSYLAVPTRGNIDSIAFWQVSFILDSKGHHSDNCQENQEQFPTLFKLAMDILPIQASSVPCERVFSSSKETITARRNSLSPQVVEALQLLKFAARQGRSLSFTEGFDKDVEIEELEQREVGMSVEDMHIFLCDLQV